MERLPFVLDRNREAGPIREWQVAANSHGIARECGVFATNIGDLGRELLSDLVWNSRISTPSNALEAATIKTHPGRHHATRDPEDRPERVNNTVGARLGTGLESLAQAAAMSWWWL